MNTKKQHFPPLSGILLLLTLLCSRPVEAQLYTIRVNPISLFALGNINAEVGKTIDFDWSMHVLVQYNPWSFGSNKLKNFTVMPGVRYWFETSEWHGLYVGGNAIVSRYNIGKRFGIKNRHDGMAYGLGGSIGYSKPIRSRLNMEIEAGLGLIYYSESQYECVSCGDKLSDDKGIRAIPTKLGINVVYIF